MRKIIVGAQMSIDGVMQAPGGPWEDPTNGFKFGGWVMPYFDQVFGEEIDRVFKEKCDLLLGRKTYEIFAGYWPYYDETAPAGGIAKLFKDIKKYVVSRSGDVDTSWQSSVLLRDIAEVKRVLFPPVLAEQQDDRRIRLREPRGRRGRRVDVIKFFATGGVLVGNDIAAETYSPEEMRSIISRELRQSRRPIRSSWCSAIFEAMSG